ncbi:hypothetical protein EJD97_008336 [Solanum chilense]|uniref:KIB1-4 beta-propeller domain-containing protein n=1 Tax=Solanum chilense TaxID=4083 RepID=A0A6N2BPY0_SOLCI|nr:hypothetical protein EJD97_008336 [Solanum chilense]
MVAENVEVPVPLLIGVPVPLLMLAEKEGNEENREFFDLTNGITSTMNFPELAGKQCLGVGIPGWLFTADGEGNMNLFHLNSRALIKLPHMNTLKGSNYDDERGYSFITVETRIATYSDVTWHDGRFYGVDVRGRVVMLDFRGGLEPTIGRMFQGIPSEFICGMHLYIVHSQGELFVITRDGIFEHPETKTYGVEEFIVSKVDVDNESYDDVNDLGNTSLFLGFSASVAVDDVQQYGCKANRIYFTDDCSCAYNGIEKGGGKDMGIYNLLDDTIEPHYTGESYHKFSPPIWIFNAPFIA